MLSTAWIIQRKRDGIELTDEEIRGFVLGVSRGEIPDYQATAFLMAVFFRGMSLDETVSLTRAMLESGTRYDLSDIPGSRVDKHSTGGVGDKVSLILAPLAAACGLKVPMMAGRGLGHSGGTLDKLESISGFDVNLSLERFKAALRKPGCAIIGQTSSICPADKKLYALRDVTATVECIPLIVASILSKKLAEGTGALVMDVKYGSGAFMKSRTDARKLAKAIIEVADKMGLPCRALLTDMNQPLGCSAGNSLEVAECVAVLRNHKTLRTPGSKDTNSGDLRELTIHLCAHMLQLGKVVRNVAEGRKLAAKKLADGSAWKVFQEMVALQGGNIEQVLKPETLPGAPRQTVWKSPRRGYVTAMDTEEIGKILVELGAGRMKASDSIHPGVGMIFHKKLGSSVQVNEPVVTVHHREDADILSLQTRFFDAIRINRARKAVPKLIFESI